MSKVKPKLPVQNPDALFSRVVSILEQARGNVVRAVNTQMVLAYWLIGREIVRELHGGEERAIYGKRVVKVLSARLTERFGQEFSPTTLQCFRKFYLVYAERCVAIPRPLGVDSALKAIRYPMGTKSLAKVILCPTGRELARPKKCSPLGSLLPQGFSPQLTSSHYGALREREIIESAMEHCTYE